MPRIDGNTQRFLHMHVAKLCRDNDIKWIIEPKSNRFFAADNSRRIWTPPINGYSSYIQALHEVGHIVNGKISSALVDEAAAWHYALDKALIVTEGALRTARNCFQSYVHHANRLADPVVFSRAVGARRNNTNIDPDRLTHLDLDHPEVQRLYDRFGA